MISAILRKAPERPDARAILLENTRDTLQWHDSADPLVRFFLGLHCELQWREFLATFGSSVGFAAASVVEQTDYIKRLVEIGNGHVDSGDEAAGRAVHLISAYLSAVASADAELERELRPVLNRIAPITSETHGPNVITGRLLDPAPNAA
jgi:hypothetical protein